MNYLIILFGFIAFVTNAMYITTFRDETKPWCFLKCFIALGAAYLTGLYIVVQFFPPEPSVEFGRIFVKPVFVYVTGIWAASGVFRLRFALQRRHLQKDIT